MIRLPCRVWLILAALLVWAPGATWAQEQSTKRRPPTERDASTQRDAPTDRNRSAAGGATDGGVLGLALAGGGALGFAHLGVLLVLEEHGISPQIVVGTSIGSIVGALYAAGYSAVEILTIVEGVDWNRIFVDEVSRRELSYEERRTSRLFRGRLTFADGELVILGGASAGQSIVEFIDGLTRSAAVVDDFSALPRRLAIVAADLVTGDEVVYTSGDVKSAVRASMSVPGAFTPLYYDDRFLIDGGWVNNIPADVAFDAGADRVIAVNLSLLNREADELRDIPTILNQASRILRRTRIEENLARSDVVITPDLEGFTSADFGRWRELVALGRAAAERALPELVALRTETVQHEVSPFLQPERDVPVTVDTVAIRAPEFLDVTDQDLIVARLTEDLTRERTSVAQVQDRVYRLYDSGAYRFVSYDLRARDDGTYHLDVYLVPEARTVSELRVGIGVRTQLFESTYVRSVFHADFRAPLGVPGSRPWPGERGPELEAQAWLSDVLSLRLGVAASIVEGVRAGTRIYTLATPRTFYDDGTLEALYYRRTAGGEVGMELRPGNQWGFETAGFAEWAWVDRRQGAAILAADGVFRLGVRGQGYQDNLDQGLYPRRGTETRVEGRIWWQEPPVIDPFIQIEGTHQAFVPIGREAAGWVRLAGATDLDTGVPTEDQFYAGGAERLAGFYFGELRGRHVLSGGVGGRIGVFDLPFAVGERAYLLAGANVAWVWSGPLADLVDPNNSRWPRSGGFVGLGFDTVVGELSLGVAMNDSFRPVSFIVLGPVAAPSGDIWSW